MNRLTSEVLTWAGDEVGVHEVAHNRGARVEEYQREAGAHPGDAWCASFVVWCFANASALLNIPSPCPVTPGALKLWQRAPQFHSQSPTAGAVFVIDHGHGLGHCGFVEGVNGDDIFTIEGNTSPEGSREGDGVYRRKRHRSEINVGYLVFEEPGAVPEKEV